MAPVTSPSVRCLGGLRGGTPISPLLVTLSLLAGCEGSELQATAVIAVAPEAVDFGAVPSGEARSVPVTVFNRSPSASLTLRAVTLAEGTSPAFALLEVPTEVPPGGEATLRVRYTPDDAEPDAGHLELHSDAVNAAVVRVPLSSLRTYPKVGVEPARLDLGSLLQGGAARAELRILSRGDATLHVRRVALRAGGFHGEPCAHDAQCEQGACLPSASGAICALPCGACPEGYRCQATEAGIEACLEDGARAPVSRRGFTVSHPQLPTLDPLRPGAAATLEVVYAPGSADRGPAQLVIETDDADDPFRVVPLDGRPEDLPPVAQAAAEGALPDPVLPGTRIPVTGVGSSDPEGGPLVYAWRFTRRPEGSRAAFEAPGAERTAFMVDRPGPSVASLEVLDARGQASTNEARVEVEATAGDRYRVELTWDRPTTDLDLHVVAAGAALGARGDCFFDNPRPDWAPPGPAGDPALEAEATREAVAVTGPPGGVFTLAVRVVAASPEGPTSAVVRIHLGDAEVARYTAALPTDAEQWDVATLTWPDGRITGLDTVR